ncbi:MAG: hypothetical protein NC080_01360 [Paraprevotella sp.]|nr:hypothetical protein [Paraprevotella sp.]
MKHLTILLSMLMFTSSSFVMAQEDDMYFSPKKAKKEQTTRKVEVIYDDEAPEEQANVAPVTPKLTGYRERDVDEYNRRGSQYTADSHVEEEDSDTRQARTYELSSQNLYDLGYSEGYLQGVGDGEDMDYYFGVRLARFHGRHFFEPWYWGSISSVYDPWYWDPWYCDPWYRPYYYGGWCSVGWGIGHWGSYWHPYWHGWHTPYPSHWGGGYRPRYSTVRNRDYGRTRIMNRSTRIGEYGRYATSGDRNGIRNSTNVRADRDSRLNQRSVDRYNRASERAGSRTPSRVTNTPNRVSTRNTDRVERRGTDRSSNHSSSRMGTGSSFPRSSGGVGSGGGRSMGSRSGGRGR